MRWRERARRLSRSRTAAARLGAARRSAAVGRAGRAPGIALPRSRGNLLLPRQTRPLGGDHVAEECGQPLGRHLLGGPREARADLLLGHAEVLQAGEHALAGGVEPALLRVVRGRRGLQQRVRRRVLPAGGRAGGARGGPAAARADSTTAAGVVGAGGIEVASALRRSAGWAFIAASRNSS